MHILKNETRDFDNYEVVAIELRNKPPTFWQRVKREQPTEEIEVSLRGIVEADDVSGLIVQQMNDKEGRPIYTNGIDDIVRDNVVTLLLLLPNIRQAFHASGFRPKLLREYKERLKIRYKGPIMRSEAREQLGMDSSEVIST